MSFLVLAIILLFSNLRITTPGLAYFPFQALVRAVVYAKCTNLQIAVLAHILEKREKNISKL